MQLQHQNLRGGDETFTSGKARQVWGDPEIGEEGRWREKVSAEEVPSLRDVLTILVSFSPLISFSLSLFL